MKNYSSGLSVSLFLALFSSDHYRPQSMVRFTFSLVNGRSTDAAAMLSIRQTNSGRSSWRSSDWTLPCPSPPSDGLGLGDIFNDAREHAVHVSRHCFHTACSLFPCSTWGFFHSRLALKRPQFKYGCYCKLCLLHSPATWLVVIQAYDSDFKPMKIE